MVRGQVRSTKTLKSLFLAQVVISCHIADFNLFLNKSIFWTYKEKSRKNVGRTAY